MHHWSERAVFTLAACFLTVELAGAQPPAPETPVPTLAIDVAPSGESATFVYFNRPIAVLRARILGRLPKERSALGVRAMDDLVARGQVGPVEAQTTEGGALIRVGPRVIIGLTAADIDEAAGETLEAVIAQAVGRAQQALEEAVEARRPFVWIWGSVFVFAALALGAVLLMTLGRGRRLMLNRLEKAAGTAVARTGLADQHAVRARQVLTLLARRLVTLLIAGLRLAVVYGVVTFALRQFPYTRPWGESLRDTLFRIVGGLALGFANAVPDLLTIVVIAIVTRSVILLLEPWFDAVERGTVSVSWIYPETAGTTRRLVNLTLWLLAAALAYPYVPGSNTDAFKGISVFVGLMFTLGSSGLINQLMSGLMLTYSRALRVGDYVRIGDVEGTIIELGALSTKVRTLRSEEATIPNAIVVSQTTTDFSRFAESVLTSTSVTLGYDAPWRQVHALLLLAVERTPGIRREPRPRVLQTGLEDAGVQYTLYFCLERQQARAATLGELYEHIQDLFNEYGVQIMTPHYEGDPAAPKIVAREDWYAAPARTDLPTRSDLPPRAAKSST
jgi:small-conductance mechanosensitive channel